MRRIAYAAAVLAFASAALSLFWTVGGSWLLDTVGGSVETLARTRSAAALALDERVLRWHVFVWDLWFVVWGAALALALAGYWREHRHGAREAPSEDEHRYPCRIEPRSIRLIVDTKGEDMISVAPKPAAGRFDRSDRTQAPNRLLVVDDHPAVRAGLKELLEDQPDFEVVAAVGTAEEALAVAERDPIDTAVVDYQLGARDGLWVSRKLKRLPQPPAVLIYSAYADGLLVAAAVVAQADGIISKGERGSDLCDAIRAVARGHSRLRPLPPWLGEALRRRFDDEEQAIFGMLLAGIDPDEVAETLNVPAAGLESRLWAMLRKLEVPHTQGQPDHLGGPLM